jgi:acyl-CoA thioesterase FadM
MNLIFRLIYVFLTAYRRGRIEPLDTGRIWLRVMPNDLDIFLHVNNGRYLTLMDLGRIDLMVRSGMLAALRARNWTPVVASAAVNFKRPLKFWQRYEMVTRIAGWDSRSIYIQQELYVSGKLMASGMIKTMTRDANNTVPAADVMAAAGYNGPSPELPPVAAQLSRTEIVDQAAQVNARCIDALYSFFKSARRYCAAQ